MANQNRYQKEIELLFAKEWHLTAEQVYKALKKHYLFLGVWSVYRNLSQMVEKWMLMKTSWIFDKVVYEKHKPLHGHIVCHASWMIFDVDISHIMLDEKLVPENFNLQSINVIFDGHFSGENAKCDWVAKIMKETEGLQISETMKKTMMDMGK